MSRLTLYFLSTLLVVSGLPVFNNEESSSLSELSATLEAHTHVGENMLVVNLDSRASPDHDAVLSDITGDVLGFLDNVGHETKQTFDNLINGLGNAVDYLETWISHVFNGSFTDSSGSNWMNPFFQTIAYASNLLADSLSGAKDPNSLVSKATVSQLIVRLSTLKGSVEKIGLNTDSLKRAIVKLAKI